MSKRRLAASWTLALLPFLLGLALRWSDGYAPEMGDYAQYLLHARAIADGRSYTDTGYIHTTLNTIGPVAYPPGLPAVLAPSLKLGADSATLQKILMAAFGACFLLAAGRALARNAGMFPALLVVALTGLSAEFVQACIHVGSDVPFGAAVWMLLALAQPAAGWSARRTAAITALGASAILFRALGVALVPAIFAFWVLNRKETGRGPLVAGLAWTATFIALNLALPVMSSYADQMAGASPIPRVLASGLLTYGDAVFDAHLYPFAWKRANDAYHVIAAGVMLIGLAVWLKSGWRSLTIWFALAYAAAALVFPLHAVRYMLPFVPLFALGLVLGIRALVKFARPALAPRRAAAVAATAVVVLAAAGAARLAGLPRTVGLTERESVRQLFDWVRQESAASNTARVVFFNPRVLTWETGVASMGYFRADPERGLSECCAKGITHVIVGDLGTENPGSAAIDRLVEEHPELFTPVFRSDGFIAYRFDREPCRNTTVAGEP